MADGREDGYYARGTEIPAEAMSLGSAKLEGTGRIQKRTVSSELGIAWTDKQFDTELKVACSSGVAVDGIKRCLPNRFRLVGSTFKDPQCSQPVSVQSDDCTQYLGLADGQFGKLGATYTGQIYQGNPTDCGPASRGAMVYREVVAVPLTTFAPVP